MSNPLFAKTTATIASLTRSRASTSPLYTFLCSPKRLLHHKHPIIMRGLRHHGSDRVWPRSVKDPNFFAAAKRIATETSAGLNLPLPTVQAVLFSMMWPRMEPLLTPKKGNLLHVYEDSAGKIGEEKNERCGTLKELKLDSRARYKRYSVYKGEWKFRGSQIATLTWRTGYSAFQAMLKDVRPEAFADDPEERGGFKFRIVWSTDGVLWSGVGNEEEFWGLLESCLECVEDEFTVLFLEDHWAASPIGRTRPVARAMCRR